MTETVDVVPNKERIAKWCDALESGEYAQGRDSLCDDFGDADKPGEFCCLAVALDLYHNETGIGKWADSTFYAPVGDPVEENEVEDADGSLTHGAMVWFGFADEDPELILPSGTLTAAINANDVRKLSFEEIAEAVRRTYLGDGQPE